VTEVFRAADERGITTLLAAEELALARLREPANA
jgi:leucine dehydrogenase